MTSYKIYLTKSPEAARLIALGVSSRDYDKRKSTECSMLFGDDRVPEIYHEQGYFAVVVTYETDNPYYDLIIC